MKYVFILFFAAALTAPAAAQAPASAPANRVVFVLDYASSKWAQGVVDRFNTRFQEQFRSIPGLTLVPVSARRTRTQTTEDVQDLCKRNNAIAVIEPYSMFQATESAAALGVSLEVEDCYGVPYYMRYKTKVESRQWVHTPLDREYVDMGNDLLDQLLTDFAAYRSAHPAAWNNLLASGVPVDPAAPNASILVGIMWEERTGYYVGHLRPEGIGARAGLKLDDVIVAIEGQPVDHNKSSFDLMQDLDKAQNVTVRRDGKDVTIVLRQAAASTGAH